MVVTLSREMVDLALQLRRHVRAEFDCDIRLREPDLIETLLDYAGRSKNPELATLGARLRALLPPEPDQPPPAAEVHYYRGAAVSYTDHGLAAPASRAAVVYRGQRVR